jgi:hypothetical protein
MSPEMIFVYSSKITTVKGFTAKARVENRGGDEHSSLL